jgi:hypothetical protein
MQRRIFISVLGGLSAVLWPLVGETQPAGKTPRIAYLGTDLVKGAREAFLQGLRDLVTPRVATW